MAQSIFRAIRYGVSVLFIMLLAANTLAADVKIAFLDEQTAVLDTERARIFRKELENELQSEIEEVQELNDSLKSLQDKIRKDHDIMSAEERQRVVNDARSKDVRVENLAESIREIQKQRLQLLFQELSPDLTSVVNAFIEAEQFDVVFRMSPQSVFYVRNPYDITAKITEKLNAKLANK